MVLERERDVIKLLISQTLGAFCRNHLAYSSQITIDALVGVTIDQNDVILVTVKESIELTDRIGENHLNDVNINTFSPETSDQLFHAPNTHLDEGECYSTEKKFESSFLIPELYQNSDPMSIKTDESQCFHDDMVKPNPTGEHPCEYGLDLSLHNKNTITVIEPSILEAEMSELKETSAKRKPSEDSSLDSGDNYSCQSFGDKSNLKLSLTSNSTAKQHLIFPFCTSHHRTSLKKRKIQLLSNNLTKKPLISNCEFSALHQPNNSEEEEVKVKLERSSPGLDLRVACTDGNTVAELPYQGSLELTKYNPPSGIDRSILGSKCSGPSSHRSLGSGQLPWVDFQNMLIKSWRRNHHEEMLLKPQAHALIESWTNSSDATSHKRIGECVQAILLYEGRYVPVRDIQRLRLSSMTSQEIRSTMEFLNSTREGKVGCYREIRGGIGVFYKCPPHLVDMEFLESFGLSLAIYETRYSSKMVSNATNRHSAVYWYRIETCSPYLTSTEVV